MDDWLTYRLDGGALETLAGTVSTTHAAGGSRL